METRGGRVQQKTPTRRTGTRLSGSRCLPHPFYPYRGTLPYFNQGIECVVYVSGFYSDVDSLRVFFKPLFEILKGDNGF